MNIPLFIVLLFCLQLFYWFVGRRSSKNLKDQEDYFFAGKSVRFFPLMMTFLATQVGGGVVLGSADEAYIFGWPVLFYPLGVALGLMLLGSGIGRKLAGFDVSTVAQIFEVVYGSTGLRKLASILSVISLFMILVAQIIASHKFLVSIGLNHTILFVLFWAIVIIYTAQGGLRAVISTDIVQMAVFAIVFLIAFAFVMMFEPSVSLLSFPKLSQLEPVSSRMCGWILMPLLFMIIEQDMGQRCFAGASPQIVSRASFVAGVCTLIICLVPVFFGTLAHVTNMAIPKGGSVLMTSMTQTTAPWMSALVGCAILAAIISTATSLINAISSNLLSDFKRQETEKGASLKTVKAITVLISIGALFFAFYFNNIVDVLIQSYELSVSCLFASIIMALIRKRGHFKAALLSVLLGALGFCFFRLYPVSFPREILSLVLSFAGYGLGEAMAHYQTKVASKAF